MALLGLCFLHQHLVYPMRVHIHHFKAQTFPREPLTGARNATESVNHKAAYGLVKTQFLPRQLVQVKSARKELTK